MDLLCLSIYPSVCSLLLPLVEVSNASYISRKLQFLGNQYERICHSS